MATPDTGGEFAVINRQHPGRAYHQGNIFGLSSLQTSSGEPLVQAWLTEPIESVVARFGPGTVMLTAMLSAVEALAPALAMELTPVRVNAVTPGLMITPLLHTAYGAERDTIVQNQAAILPGKRVDTADEVAHVMLMLMANDDMTGEMVPVNGGGGLDHRGGHPILQANSLLVVTD